MELDISNQSHIVHCAVAKYYVALHRIDRDDVSHPDDEGVWEKMALGMQAFDPLMPTENCISPALYDRWISKMESMVEYICSQRILNPKNQRLTRYDPIEEPLESYIDTVFAAYGRIELPTDIFKSQK